MAESPDVRHLQDLQFMRIQGFDIDVPDSQDISSIIVRFPVIISVTA